MSSRMPTRRTVVRTAAWSVPAVSLATAAPAFATSGQPAADYEVVATSFPYNVTASNATLGINIAMGVNTLHMTLRVPRSPFPTATALVPTVVGSASIELNQSATESLRSRSVAWLAENPADLPEIPLQFGTSAETLAMRVARYTVPATGLIIVPITGGGTGGVTTTGTPGTTTVTMGVPRVALKAQIFGITGDVNLVFSKVAGQDYTVHTFDVG